MPLPEPSPGLVFRYDYLWSREAAAGRDQGKERPACLVAALDSSLSRRFRIFCEFASGRSLRAISAI